MSEIIVIAAIAKNNVIGRGMDIPWHISDDFKRFKELTTGHVVIMGDKTYESLPVKPLPDRENIVLTFNKNYRPEGTKVMYSFEDAIEYSHNKKKVFIIGGASIYKLGIQVADKLELTRIYRDFDGDVFFPEFDLSKWEIVREEKRHDSIYGDYSFITYKRKE